jgi:voltage-gated potassium channel
MTDQGRARRALDDERYELLRQLSDLLEMPMVVLGLVWLVLLIVDLVHGLNPFLQVAVTVIWAVFVLYFLLELLLAPSRWAYVRRNWLTVISLFIPALRVFRIVRAMRVLRLARAAPEVRLVRVVSSLNRGMAALRSTFGRRGIGYVVALTVLITLGGAAGMYAFEHGAAGSNGFASYGASLWWTAMIMTTLGSAAWPVTPEGRVLAIVLALYAFAVFGYVTATLASFFIDRDADADDASVAGTKALDALRSEVEALRADVRSLASRLQDEASQR